MSSDAAPESPMCDRCLYKGMLHMCPPVPRVRPFPPGGRPPASIAHRMLEVVTELSQMDLPDAFRAFDDVVEGAGFRAVTTTTDAPDNGPRKHCAIKRVSTAFEKFDPDNDTLFTPYYALEDLTGVDTAAVGPMVGPYLEILTIGVFHPFEMVINMSRYAPTLTWAVEELPDAWSCGKPFSECLATFVETLTLLRRHHPVLFDDLHLCTDGIPVSRLPRVIRDSGLFSHYRTHKINRD